MAKRQKEQVNELEQIEAFFSTKSEHRNSFFFEMYKEAESEAIFETSLIPLQTIDGFINQCYLGRAKPIQTTKAVIKEIDGFGYEQQCFIYDHLIKFLDKTEWTGEDGQKITLEKIKDILDNEFLHLLPENWQPPVKKYDFERVKEHLKTLPETKDKIKYLIEQQTEFSQNEGMPILGYGENSFADLCSLEIKKLEKLLKLEQSTPAQKDTALSKVNSAFTLSKALSKIDYIRIINALSELRCFQNDDGTYPAKKEVMKAFGNLANIDLSNYDKDLNKAFTGSATLEANLSVFEKMKEKTQEIYLSKLNKPQK